MKKYMKGLFLLALPLMAALVSCSEDDAKYEPAEKPTNEQVYFPVSELPTSIDLPANGKYTITLMRQNTEGELTVNLVTEQDEKSTAQVTVPQTVTFADGESTVDVVITYDPSTIKFDDKNKVTIKIADESVTTPYGSSFYSFSAMIPAPFKSIGMGMFSDLWFYNPEEGSPFVPVEILQNEADPNTFRLVKPTAGLLSAYSGTDFTVDGELGDYMEITVVPAGESVINSKGSVLITSTDDVQYVWWYDDYSTGFIMPDHDDIYLMCPMWFGYDMSYNKVVCYQEPDEDGNILPAEIELAPFHLTADFYGQLTHTNEGIIRILFPGYEPRDYAAELAYRGILTNPANEIFACGDLTLGEDATDVRAIVMPADVDPEAVADAIAAGDLDAVQVEAGRIEVPFDTETLEGEQFQLIVVVLDEAGAVQNVATAPFEYYGSGDTPWGSIGTGYYTDGVLPSIFEMEEGDPEPTYEVEILGRSDKPGLYRLVNAYVYGTNPYLGEGEGGAPGDFIEVNATNPDAVYIPYQSTKVDWGYGEIFFQTAGPYLQELRELTFEDAVSAGLYGTLAGESITFPTFTYDYEGKTYPYKGVADMGSYTDLDVGVADDGFTILLPSAPSYAKAKAAAKVRATDFAARLSGRKFIGHKAPKASRVARFAKKLEVTRLEK